MTKAPCLLLLTSIVLSACGGSSVTPSVDGSGSPANQIRSNTSRITSPSVSAADATQLATDNLALGVDLYSQLRAANSGNFIFSQTSISLALAMLYGDRKSTRLNSSH